MIVPEQSSRRHEVVARASLLDDDFFTELFESTQAHKGLWMLQPREQCVFR